MTYQITANSKGTRKIDVTDRHLATLAKYNLLEHLVDSNGIVDESVLDKLRFNVRSILSTESGNDKDLLDLCLDVLYHSDMKALGLANLIALYQEHKPAAEEPATESEP